MDIKIYDCNASEMSNNSGFFGSVYERIVVNNLRMIILFQLY